MGSATVSGLGSGGLRGTAPILHLVVLEDRPGLDVTAPQRSLHAADRARAFQISNPDIRRQFVLGRFLLWRMLEELRVPRTKLEIGPLGKPYLDERPIDFNLSHTRGGIAVLLGHGELGVDIEPSSRAVDVEGVGLRTFTHSELQWVRAGDPGDRFIQMWTLKEAYMKARGTGFRLSPKSFTFEISDRDVRIVRSRDRIERGWVFHQQRVGDLRVALAARGPGSERGAELRRYDGAALL